VNDLIAISAGQVKRQWLQKIGKQAPAEEEWRVRN